MAIGYEDFRNLSYEFADNLRLKRVAIFQIRVRALEL